VVIEKTSWFNQPLSRRVRIWMAYGLARLAMGILGLERRL
jgi:hypothetical protein